MIDNIRILFEKGDNGDIIDKIKALEENQEFSKLSLTKRIEYKYYQSRAFEQKGLFNEALEVATTYRRKIPNSDQLVILPLIVAQSYALRRLGSLDKGLKVCQEGEELIDSIQKAHYGIENVKEWIAHLYHITGSLNQLKGKLETALDYSQRSLAISEKIGNPDLLARSLNNIGLIHQYKGDLETALDYYSRSLALFEEIGNPQLIAVSLNNIGLIYWKKGELETALDYYQRSLPAFEKIGNLQQIAISLVNIGQVYQYKGDLDTALDYFQKSLRIRGKIGNDQDIADSLNSIGQNYHLKGDLDTAYTFLLKSLAIRKELGNSITTAETVFNLIQLSFAQNKQAQTLSYLAQLEELDKQMSNKHINLRYRLAKAWQLKKSRRIENKAKAQDLLAKIVSEEVIEFPLTSLAMVHYVMLLLDEFKTYDEPEVMEEIKLSLNNLFTIAENLQSHFLIVNVLILRSRFAMIGKDLDLASKYLDRALITAKECNLSGLQKKVEMEKKKLENQLDEWKARFEKKRPIQEMLSQVDMTSYLNEIQFAIAQGISSQISIISRKKYQLIYQDVIKEQPENQKYEFRVGVAQFGLPIENSFLSDYYEEFQPGLFGLKEAKIEEINSKIRECMEIAVSNKTNILFFSELAIDLNYSLLLNTLQEYSRIYNMYIIPGSYHDRDTRRNISPVISPEGILWTQEKHIPATMTYDGQRFTEGIEVSNRPRKTIVCDTIYGRIAIVICRDFMDMDLRVELKNCEPPIDLIFNPAFTPVTADFKAAHFDARRSIYAYCFFANVAEFGDSLIYTPEKERIDRIIPKGKESIIFKDVDLFKLRTERKKWELLTNTDKTFIQSTR
ncbi:MAG: tetratricopeptide repeat protein [Candidatus Hermodarchaeota archaeon]